MNKSTKYFIACIAFIYVSIYSISFYLKNKPYESRMTVYFPGCEEESCAHKGVAYRGWFADHYELTRDDGKGVMIFNLDQAWMIEFEPPIND